jgi:hypothetical protein
MDNFLSKKDSVIYINKSLRKDKILSQKLKKYQNGIPEVQMQKYYERENSF